MGISAHPHDRPDLGPGTDTQLLPLPRLSEKPRFLCKMLNCTSLDPSLRVWHGLCGREWLPAR
jgi:hypothetical protein